MDEQDLLPLKILEEERAYHEKEIRRLEINSMWNGFWRSVCGILLGMGIGWKWLEFSATWYAVVLISFWVFLVISWVKPTKYMRAYKR